MSARKSERLINLLIALLSTRRFLTKRELRGIVEDYRDSGDVARRLGDEATFQQLAKRNIQTLAKYKFQRIVTWAGRTQFGDVAELEGLADDSPLLPMVTSSRVTKR